MHNYVIEHNRTRPGAEQQQAAVASGETITATVQVFQ